MQTLLIIWFFLCHACGPELTVLRENYMRVNSEQLAARTILETSANSSLPLPIKKGYHGAATMCMARYAINPAGKIALFRKGRAELEDALRQEPGNTELMFLRYTIQQNAPAFLQYRSSMDSDLRKIRQSLDQLQKSDPQLYIMISTYLLTRN